MKMELSMGTVIFGIIGVAGIIYCAILGLFSSGTRFYLIWAALGILSLFLAMLFMPGMEGRFPNGIRLALCILTGVGIIIGCSIIGIILTKSHAKAQPGADYCIVLGAQWKSEGPSDVLRRRLDKAIDYLDENPETKVVVSGGQGRNEKCSEADGMKEYLLNAGISKDRILVENRSRNTAENLMLSAKLLNKEKSRVVIVTSNFHMYRALKIAEKQGYQAEGMSASSAVWMLPNNLVREVLALFKELLVGNI